MTLLRQIGLLTGIFVVTAALADLFGAANLGVSMGIAQIVFAVALVAMLLRA